MSKVDDDDEVKPLNRMLKVVEEEEAGVVMDKNMFVVVVELVVHWDREILVVVV